VEEVEVKTGGYEAEYGGALGGILNVVTKSGGNELHGDLFGYFTNDDLLQSASPNLEAYGRRHSLTEYDFGVDLGGKFIEDRLWYFVALNPSFREEEFENRQGHVGTAPTNRPYYAGKLTRIS
jgi:outer membrane receptor protein involved in Fe transport